MEEVRRIVGVELSDAEVEALAAWYANLARGVAAFPAEDLKWTEPPLRSVPGPVI
jgi:cytochrome c553